jgi:hypothetical protein
VPVSQIDAAAADLAVDLNVITPPPSADELSRLRHHFVSRQLAALRARVSILSGTKMRFDQESKALYDVIAPPYTEEESQATLAELDKRLPGVGRLLDRYDAFRSRFVIPRDRLDRTFRAAIDECRARTVRHLRLPDEEQFTVEYVTGKTWSAYNWYQGAYRSVIQVNTDLPIFIDRALDLACHEGYPGHHVYNVLIEQHLVRERGWVEWSVYPLFSPQSLIAEGTANFGVAVAFPDAARLAFERDELFPRAGLDPAQAARYQEVQRLAARLSYAGNEAARRYLDGRSSAAEAVAWLQRYALMSHDRAVQRVRFFDRYRSYVINYNLGEDLVESYVDGQGGTDANPSRRWDVFLDLLRVPRLPGELALGR